MNKVGMMIGANLVVAAMMMQGCKAPRYQHNPEANVTAVTAEPAPIVAEPAPAPAVAEPAPAPVVVEPAPAKVAAVPAESVPEEKYPAAVPPAPAPECTLYVVKGGDTLSGIAACYGLKQKDILAVNPGMKPNRLFVGKKIKLPGKVALKGDDAAAAVKAPGPKVAAKKGTAANVTAPAKSKAAFKAYEGATKEYVVKSGDTLGKVAYANGITIRALKELNALKSNNLKIGQKLKVPADGKAAKAAPKAAKAAPKTEKKASDVKAAEKTAVQPAVKAAEPAVNPAVPAAPAPAASAAPAPAPAPAPAAEAASAPAAEATPAPAPAHETYKVQSGDDVVGIAIKFGVSPSELVDLNDIKPSETLQPGRELKIPAKADK